MIRLRGVPAARATLLVAACCIAALLVAVPAPGAVTQAVARHVIVLSLDGVRADALQSVWTESLRRRGAISWAARTVRPSATLPAHTSMVTGVDVPAHGVRFNEWDTSQDRLFLPTIFTRVRGAGGGVVIIVTKPKLRFLAPEQMPVEWLLYPRYRMPAVIATAAERFRDQRPALLFVHVADPDDAGHRDGWMSAPYMAVVRQIPGLVDQFLARVRAAGVWEQTLLIVTADHGGHGRLHGTARPEDVTIPWIALGGAARPGVALAQPVAIYDTAPTVLHALGIPIPSDWQGRPVVEALAQAPVRR